MRVWMFTEKLSKTKNIKMSHFTLRRANIEFYGKRYLENLFKHFYFK